MFSNFTDTGIRIRNTILETDLQQDPLAVPTGMPAETSLYRVHGKEPFRSSDVTTALLPSSAETCLMKLADSSGLARILLTAQHMFRSMLVLEKLHLNTAQAVTKNSIRTLVSGSILLQATGLL